MWNKDVRMLFPRVTGITDVISQWWHIIRGVACYSDSCRMRIIKREEITKYFILQSCGEHGCRLSEIRKCFLLLRHNPAQWIAWHKHWSLHQRYVKFCFNFNIEIWKSSNYPIIHFDLYLSSDTLHVHNTFTAILDQRWNTRTISVCHPAIR